MSFDAVIFPLNLRRCVPRNGWSTSIVELGNGAEQRLSFWADARLDFNASLGVRSLNDLKALLQFHRLRRGRARGFLITDLSDYKVDRTFLVESQFAVGDSTTKVFQLTKTYADNWNADVRPITKPRVGTVQIYADGSLVSPSSYVVNYCNGKVYFHTAPATGIVLDWSGEFYVPVRFDTDIIDGGQFFSVFDYNATRQEWTLTSATSDLPDVPMVEVRDIYPNFDPRETRGAAYWWASDVFNAAGVPDGTSQSTWRDRIAGLALAVSGTPPAYRTEGLNGYDTLTFSGGYLFGSCADFPDAATVIVAARAQSAGAIFDFTTVSNGAALSLYTESSGRVVARAVTSAGTFFTFFDGLSFPIHGLFSVRLDANRVYLRHNGQLKASASMSGALVTVAKVWLGAAGGGTSGLTGAVGELAAHNVALTDGELAQQERVLGYKYGYVF